MLNNTEMINYETMPAVFFPTFNLAVGPSSSLI